MKNYIVHLFKLWVVWLLLFAAGRVLFILYFYYQFVGTSFTEMVMVFVKGFPLDVSAAGYLLLLPFGVLLLQSFLPGHFYRPFLKIYFFTVLLLQALIVVGDLGIYAAWGTKLNARAVLNLLYPKEMMASVGSSPIWLFVLLMALQVVLGWWLFRKLFKTMPGRLTWNLKTAGLWLVTNVAVLFLLIVSVRGGMQTIPVTESVAYFSNKPILNHAAVNTPWYLLHSLLENSENLNTNPYLYLPAEDATRLVDSLYHSGRDTTINFLTTPRPNIVFIQLESFTADVVKELGGLDSVTPNLSRLIQEGLLFNSIYSSGFRTDQGLVALLGGFPAQPSVSIIRQADKLEHIPSLARVMHQAGYHTSYYYGGEMNFANMKAYVHANGFDVINGGDAFPAAQQNTKWGAPDEYVFQKQQKEATSFPQPFFSYVVTLSSHEPFEVPRQTPYSNRKDLPGQFCHGAWYTDECLGEYFNYVKTQPWYSNTLFVLIADHGHHLPKERLSYEPAHQHIPLLFFGEVIKPEFRGAQWPYVGSQTDVVATLLAQLGLPHGDFHWSNNLANPHRGNFAFYTFDNGVGWVSLADTFAFDNVGKRIIYPANTENNQVDSMELKKAKAYLQEVFEEYLRD